MVHAAHIGSARALATVFRLRWLYIRARWTFSPGGAAACAACSPTPRGPGAKAAATAGAIHPPTMATATVHGASPRGAAADRALAVPMCRRSTSCFDAAVPASAAEGADFPVD